MNQSNSATSNQSTTLQLVQWRPTTDVKLRQHQIGLHSVHGMTVRVVQVAMANQGSTAQQHAEMVKPALQTFTQNHL